MNQKNPKERKQTWAAPPPTVAPEPEPEPEPVAVPAVTPPSYKPHEVKIHSAPVVATKVPRKTGMRAGPTILPAPVRVPTEDEPIAGLENVYQVLEDLKSGVQFLRAQALEQGTFTASDRHMLKEVYEEVEKKDRRPGLTAKTPLGPITFSVGSMMYVFWFLYSNATSYITLLGFLVIVGVLLVSGGRRGWGIFQAKRSNKSTSDEGGDEEEPSDETEPIFSLNV